MKFFILLIIFALYGEESASYRLENGMQIVLKPNKENEAEVIIQLMAKGGFAMLPEDQLLAGYFAGDLVWEAGFADRNSDQISNDLYNNYSDFYLDITPFYRKIECETYEGGISTCLGIIKDIFTKPRINDLKKVQKKLDLAISSNDTFEDCVMQINTLNYTPLKKISLYELKRIDSKIAGEFFKASFENPEEFVCVIVGDFEEAKAIPLIQKILGTIPKKPSSLFQKSPIFPPFPKGVTKEICKIKKRNDYIVRFTFPLTLSFTEPNLRKLDVLVNVINRELAKSLQVNVDTGFELPFYPYAHTVWLTIQINSLTPLDFAFGDRVVKELKQFKTFSLELEEVESEAIDNYWLSDNNYLATNLANFALWNWDLKAVNHKITLNAEEIKDLMSQWIDLNHYSEVINQ